MQELFPDNFLSGIGRLALTVRAAPPRAAHGVHLSPRTGASLEFRDYQAYTPGDDLRRVDWAVYGRTRHLFVRRYERPTAVPVFVLVDASASMMLETPSRYAMAARVAAAIASSAVAGHNPLRVVIADGNAAAAPRAVTGRRGLVRVLADLAADRTAAGPGPAAALEAVLPSLAAQGRGILVIISDFFEQRGLDPLLNLLRQAPQRLVMVRVTQPWDADPDIQGDLELADCESDARLQVSTDPTVLKRYREAYQSYFKTLDDFAAARGAARASFDASADPLPQLERLFPGGTLSL